MTKLELAVQIESHHLYQGEYSKNYYKYSSEAEIKKLMKHSKQELQDMYDQVYDEDGHEYTSHEINW